MPSPFVGMDPFLEDERLWPWFQHQLAITLKRILTVWGYRYRVRISERRFRCGPQDHGEVRTDSASLMVDRQRIV
jgi:hypothetical protein